MLYMCFGLMRSCYEMYKIVEFLFFQNKLQGNSKYVAMIQHSKYVQYTSYK